MLIRSSGFVPAICNYLLEHCGSEPEQAANCGFTILSWRTICHWVLTRDKYKYHTCQPFLQPGQLTWLHMHALSSTPKSWAKFLAFIIASAIYTWLVCYLKRPTVNTKFVPPMSGLPSSVETQTSAMHTSTSVIFAPGPRHYTLTVALYWPLHVHASRRRSSWNIWMRSFR